MNVRMDPYEEALVRGLGRRVEVLRKRRKMSCEKLATRARIHRNTLYRIEAGDGRMHVVVLARIAAALGATVADLMQFAPSMVDSKK